MDYLSTISLITGLVSLTIAFVMLAKARDRVHFVLIIFLLSLSLWGFGGLGYSTVSSEFFAILWWRIAQSGLVMIPAVLTHFCMEFLGQAYARRHFIAFLYLVSSAFLLANLFSSILFQPLALIIGPASSLGYDTLYGLFVAYSAAVLVFDIIVLQLSYRERLARERLQIRFMSFALVVGAAGQLFSLVASSDGVAYQAGNAGLFLSALIITYTIIRYRLLDLKFALRQYSVYGITLFLLFVLASVVRHYGAIYYPDDALRVDFGYLIFAISVFETLRVRVGVIANRYFFSSLYDSKKLISDVGEKLRSTLDLARIHDYVFSSIDDAMHVKGFGILRYEEKKRYYSTRFNINFNIGRRANIAQNDALVDILMGPERCLVLTEHRELEEDMRVAETIQLFKRLKVEVVLPLCIQERVTGLLVLGPKEAGDIYNQEDVRVLAVIASQAAMAIENSMLYEDTKSNNAEMEKEVQKATTDLRIVNERLKKLDLAKSEFISIASHQLRTPLTVIKGYISMMLEGSFGPLPDPMRDPMDKVFESNERLISLVDNLLNISRIESGHLKFSFAPLDLGKLVQDIVDELMSKATEKGLKLELKLPKRLSQTTADAEKLRQVVMNLVDNSIKYTPAGTVRVAVSEKAGRLRFTVNDNGIGIPAEDIPNLFKKFARGTGASLKNTEGTGLGLYVAKEMIDAHKGEIWVRSDGEGKGAEFGFEVPVTNV